MTTPQNELARGWKIHQQGNLAAAEQIYRNVLAQAPKDSAAWCYLGIALHDQRQHAAAVEAYRSALALNANFPIALNNLGNSLRYLHEFEAADNCFQQAIDLKPDYLNAYKNRGTLHVWSGRLATGLSYYEQAMRLNPQDAELHRNLGVIYLLQGRFAEGWREYRWRWRVGDLRRPTINAPIWDGSDLNGKSILLSVEQGLGDTLHFVRFARLLRNCGARTLIYVQPPLLALLQNSRELGAVFPNNLPLDQPFDFQCSLLDVADFLHTDLSNIPQAVPYVQPSTQLVRYWGERLTRTATPKLRIGIAWQGNPDHQADTFRSIPLHCFQTLAELPHVELISLQSGHGSEQVNAWKGPPLTLLGDQVDQSSGAFMDTAAIMKSLDLVITSDTAIAHLAGALAVPTWIAMGFMPDWRWLLDRSDSPWYPTARLFRQNQIGDWSDVFESMRVELLKIPAERTKNEDPPTA